MRCNIISKKWIIGGISLLLIISSACYIWYQHDIAAERKAAADTSKLTRLYKIERKVDTDIDEENQMSDPEEIARKQAEGQNTVEFYPDEPPQPKSKTGKYLQTEKENTVKQDDTTKTVDTVSPYGFGPYPEIPIDFPFPVEWHFKGSNANHELMARIAIKLWNQGIDTWGITMVDGLAYPNYIDTVYVRWGETTDENGNPNKYMRRLGGYPPACQRIVSNNIERHGERRAMTSEDIPTDITVNFMMKLELILTLF
ncbi:hypothetical protein JT359_07130 [Candidatus Poribacteria bacterium]|nr:hypothetical protein [Candidatus Poribacteria bacterium]